MQPQNLASLKRYFIAALRIIYHEGLSDAFAHLSARLADGKKMLFMPRKRPASTERAWELLHDAVSSFFPALEIFVPHVPTASALC